MQHHPASRTTAIEPNIDRRGFLRSAVSSAATIGTLPAALTRSDRVYAAPSATPPIIDAHMHVWSNDPLRYPFAHPYLKDFTAAPHAATVEMLLKDMDRHGCTHSILVQVIYHGWDNTYVAECVEQTLSRDGGEEVGRCVAIGFDSHRRIARRSINHPAPHAMPLFAAVAIDCSPEAAKLNGLSEKSEPTCSSPTSHGRLSDSGLT